MVQEPFCRGLGYAIQWYDCLRLEIDKQVECIITSCDKECKNALQRDLDDTAGGPVSSYLVSFPSTPSRHVNQHTRVRELHVPQSTQCTPECLGLNSPTKNIIDPESSYGLCDCYLQQLCPACFAGRMHGRPFTTRYDTLCACAVPVAHA